MEGIIYLHLRQTLFVRSIELQEDQFTSYEYVLECVARSNKGDAGSIDTSK